MAENADWRHRLWARLGPSRADAVVVPTQHVARDLGRALAPQGKVHVVPWGVASAFAEEPPPGVVDELVLERYRLPERPLVLCLGAVRAKKNLAALVRGLARVHERGELGLHLVVTGEDTPQLRKDLGLVARAGMSRWVSTPGAVDEADLPSLLRLAAVVAVLSSSEGFALPVLEALACGTPVVVPRDSAQSEVGGAEAICVDPEDPDSVAQGLERAAREREALRWTLPDRAREFTWDRTAEALETIWSDLA